MSDSEHFDSIIIGAGQAGGPLSTALGEKGQRVALIEQEHVGGTCINEGCTPTKTMVASARVAYLARRATDYGVHFSGPVTVDMQRVRQRKRDIVDSFRSGSERRVVQSKGVELINGAASFTGPSQIEVKLNDGGTRQLSATHFFINTGERPALPKLEGLDGVEHLNSTTVMELDVVPEHLLILGGGYIGLEFGQMFRRFGSRVTIVQRGKQLLTREDADIAEQVTEILRQDQIEILLETQAVKVEETGDTIRLTIKNIAGERVLEGSHLLIAGGRMPNTDKLNLAATGVETNERGYIKVNDRLETNVPNIYGLGDVKGGPAFTHISYDDFRIIRTNLVEGGHASIKDRLLPYTVFIDPQLGRVGLSENDARQQGLNIKVAKMPMSSVARALEVDETRGVMKVIINADNDQILGGAILGLEGGEMMSMLQLAMMGKLPYTILRDAVFAHPTLAESYNNIFSGV